MRQNRSDGPVVTARPNRKRGTWYADVLWQDSGKRTRPSLGVPIDQDPAAALADFKREILPGMIREHHQAQFVATHESSETGEAGPRLRDLADWMVDVHLPFLGRAPKTIMHYRRVLTDFVAYCATRHVARASQLSWRIVQEWQTWAGTIRGDGAPSRDQLRAVRHWLNEAHEAGELQEASNIKWTLPKKKKGSRFRAIDREEIARFEAALKDGKPALYPIIAWCYATGWRISDVLDLRWGEVDSKRGMIEREQIKTSAALPYPITPRMRELLGVARAGLPKKMAPAAYVFRDAKGKPWTYHRFKKKLEYFIKKRWDGENITPRDLRKSFGSHLAMAGCPPNVLKELLGHEDVALTLSFYVDVDMGRMAEWAVRHQDGR